MGKFGFFSGKSRKISKPAISIVGLTQRGVVVERDSVSDPRALFGDVRDLTRVPREVFDHVIDGLESIHIEALNGARSQEVIEICSPNSNPQPRPCAAGR